MKTYIRVLLCGVLIFYLGLHNGYLAVFKGKSSQPLYCFERTSDIFPGPDQQALRQGIPFSRRDELARLLEDYLS